MSTDQVVSEPGAGREERRRAPREPLDSREDAPLTWVKSSRSNANTGGCVQIALAGGAVALRDSKNPGGAILRFHAGAWAAFLRGVRRGELD